MEQQEMARHPSQGSTGAGVPPGPQGAGRRDFISYIKVEPQEEEADLDGLDQTARLQLEQKAIERILTMEPHLRRAQQPNNPKFDLYEAGPDGTLIRWIEVKAMTGSLRDRPVGLSHTQFKFAWEQGEAYWLYIVEHAGAADARVVRIQNPAGKAKTFTFDRGWLAAAEAATNARSDSPED